MEVAYKPAVFVLILWLLFWLLSPPSYFSVFLSTFVAIYFKRLLGILGVFASSLNPPSPALLSCMPPKAFLQRISATLTVPTPGLLWLIISASHTELLVFPLWHSFCLLWSNTLSWFSSYFANGFFLVCVVGPSFSSKPLSVGMFQNSVLRARHFSN